MATTRGAGGTAHLSVPPACVPLLRSTKATVQPSPSSNPARAEYNHRHSLNGAFKNADSLNWGFQCPNLHRDAMTRSAVQCSAPQTDTYIFRVWDASTCSIASGILRLAGKHTK